MSFTGKATYSAGASLPESAEDVADLVAINSPHETPLLDALGDAPRTAHSTIHEWLEDSLLPNTDSIASVTDSTHLVVANIDRFQAGDQIQVDGESEVILVTDVDSGTATITVTRSYGGTASGNAAADDVLHILGNAALEGADASAARFTARSRLANYTQIFSSTVEVSGSELAVRQIGVRDELDYQKNQRLRELLRDLENCVINGVAPAATQQGSASVRRTMKGVIPFIQSNTFAPGTGGFPAGTTLSEDQLNAALREIWKSSNGEVDLILVGGTQKRAINNFVATNRRFTSDDESFKNLISVYESDFGVCRILMSRFVPSGNVLLLDSSRIEVVPLSGRSFHYKPLAVTGDRESGQLIGEYTLELRNENAHGLISGLA
ncbi:MAG TPA: DUF5309 family protein [Tepidisphaeraceae bacterium]|jgi:hypothetical protein|nr:DUF5309 family protein [Tepidisphaeraceae bacterium]